MPAGPSPTEQLAAMLNANNSAALPPVPDASEGNPLARWFSNGGVAGMLGMTPAYQQIAENQASADAAPDLKSKLAILLQNPVAGALGVDAPIRAYHGSPYSFDKFDLSKIGTGEGAQAYGHGLYFAGNEGVARSYREALSGSRGPTVLRVGGDVADPFDAAVQHGLWTPEQAAALKKVLPDPSADAIKDNVAFMLKDKGINAHVDNNPGHMYEVALHADPASLLDWDKPLSQQPQVQEAFQRIAPDIASADVPGQLAYYRLGGRKLQSPEASTALQQAGIPGIQYLDAGSRNAPDTSYLIKSKAGNWSSQLYDDLSQAQAHLPGYQANHFPDAAIEPVQNHISRNYVMFDPARIEIMRKYGLLAGMLGGGAAAAGGDQQ